MSRTLSRSEFSQLQLFGSAHWRVHTGRSKCCPITKPIHYTVRLWAVPGEDLSCSISNSRVVAPCASLQSPTVPTSDIWAARPYSISTGETRVRAGRGPGPPGPPLALPQGMPCPPPAARTRLRDSHSSLSDSGTIRNTLQLCYFLEPFCEDRENSVIDVDLEVKHIYSFAHTII